MLSGGAPKSAGLMKRRSGVLVRLFAETPVFGADVADARRQIRAMIDMVRTHLPERKKDLCLLDLCSSIGTRETRRFRAKFQLTEKDLLHGRRFDDAIANGAIRVMITMNQTGEAAGEAAAFVCNGEVAADIDPRKLRDVLREGGSIVL